MYITNYRRLMLLRWSRAQKQLKRTNHRVVSTKIQSMIKFLNVLENAEIGAFQISTEIDFESQRLNKSFNYNCIQ